MHVNIKQVQNVLIVELQGELDHHTSAVVRDSIEKELDKGSTNKIVLDCSHLTFMDSSGLGIILGRYKRLQSEGGNMVACNCSEQVTRIFELSGLMKIVKIYPTVSAALAEV